MSIKPKKVLIYQMGKVASSSIKATLSRLDNLEIIYTHRLSYAYAKQLNLRKKTLGWKVVSLEPSSIKDLHASVSAEPRLKVITLIREPIARNISAFFQVLDAITGIKNAYSKLTIVELMDIFLKQYPHEIPLIWFDQEFKEALGIDVYNVPFPKDKGVMTLKKGRYEALVMRHDLNDHLKQQSMEAFLGIEPIGMQRDNISMDKPYSAVYELFKASIKLSDQYVTQLLESAYARHFYSKEECVLIRKKWS